MSSHEEHRPELIEIESDEDTSIGLLMSVDDGDAESTDSPQTVSKLLVATTKCVWPKRIAPKCVESKRIKSLDTSQLISKEVNEQKPKKQKQNVNEQKEKEQKLLVNEQKPKKQKLNVNEQKVKEQKLKGNEQKVKEEKLNVNEQKVKEEILSAESMTGLTASRGPYQCQLCIKSFSSTQQLTQHSLVHSNLRKHQCPFCDKTFKQLSHLQQHQRIHTGEMPYPCFFENCERSFRQSSSLKQHMKGHTRDLDVTTANDQSISSVAKPRIWKSRPNKSRIKIEEQKYYEFEKQPMKEEQQEETYEDKFPDCLTSLPPSPVSEQCRLTSEESLPSSSNKRATTSLDNHSEVILDDNKRARATLNDFAGLVPGDIESDDIKVKVEPIYRQSLVSLSSKLEEISKRERSLRFSADQLFSGKKPLQ